MKKTRSKLARMALMAACAALPLAGLGCEGERGRADKRAAEQFKLISAELDKGDKASPQVVRDALQKIAGDAQAFDALQLAAKAKIAQDDEAAAVALLGQLNSHESKVRGLLARVEQLASGIATDIQLIKAYTATNPQEAIKAYEAGPVKEARERLAKADEQVKKLTADIAAKDAQIESLRKAQAAAMEKYATLKAQSEKAKGAESVKLYNAAMAAWSEAEQAKIKLQPAAELKVAGLEGEAASAREALKAAEEDKKLAGESLKLAQDQVGELNKSWQATQALIAARTASAKASAGEQGIAGAAKKAATEMAAAEQLRKTVIEKLEKAATGYEAAAAAARKLDSMASQKIAANRESPTVGAWKALQKTFSAYSYQLGQARVLQRTGQLYMNQRTLLAEVQRVAKDVEPALKGASVALAPELVMVAAAGAKDAASKAEAALAAADAIYVEPGNAAPSEKTEATIGHIINRYAMYSLKGQKNLLSEAKNQLKELLGNEDVAVVLPALADDLETRDFISMAAAAARAAAKPAPAAVPTEEPKPQ